MKVSVSLPDDDVAFLDAYASARGLASRSAAVARAIRLLRTNDLAEDYERAWDEWHSSDDGSLWEGTSGDGV